MKPMSWRSRLSFLVGRPRPFGRWIVGWRFSSRARAYSAGGVRSSRYCERTFAPTRWVSSPTARTVRVSSPILMVKTSPIRTLCAGLRFWPASLTWPALHADAASDLVLNTLVAQSHLSSRTSDNVSDWLFIACKASQRGGGYETGFGLTAWDPTGLCDCSASR